MGMSTHVFGFRPPDERWHEMKAVWDSCTAAAVEPPEEVSAFFEWIDPDPQGVEVDLGEAVRPWNGLSASGFEVHVADLPKDVTVVRLVNSW